MITKEEEKIIRIFQLITVWTLFLSVTVAGLILADARTEYIGSGKEAETVILAEFRK